jgi:FkbM family methyltransferase
MSSPTISVVMTVFNGEEFLSETVDSVLNQSFRDFEFIIVDDGSTDATADILSKYAPRDSRIRVLRNGKKGRAASLNLGISLANGKYVANNDADDLATPGRLEEQVAFMERNPEVGVLGSAYEVITDSGAVIDLVRHPLEDSEIRSVILRDNPICHSSAILRKDIALAVGGYRSTFEPSEDYDLWLRMSERSKLANLHNVLVRYRVHANQLSVRKLEHQRLCVLAASTAAAFRKQGRPDPFSGVERITPELLRKLGVTKADIRDCLGVGQPFRDALRVRLWHPLLNFTRPLRHALGLRQKSVKAVARFENSSPGPLVFDVGANIGAKTEQYLRNGARVVCFEPQSACVDALRERFRGNGRVVVVPTALGAHIGEAEISICTQENAISTFADAWKTGRFKGKRWDRAEVVPVTTLDAAIGRHGMPFYCKIDVEGFEHSVLSGLTRQIPVLSFEFCAEGLDQTQACLDLLSRLGYTAFNACLGETSVYVLRAAVSSAELMNHLRSMSDPLAWGDVYAAVGSKMPDSRLLPRPLLR